MDPFSHLETQPKETNGQVEELKIRSGGIYKCGQSFRGLCSLQKKPQDCL